MGMVTTSPFGRFLVHRRAVTAIEYAVIAAISAMVIVTGLTLFGYNFGITTGHVTDALNGQATAALPTNVSTPQPVINPAISQPDGSSGASTTTNAATTTNITNQTTQSR